MKKNEALVFKSNDRVHLHLSDTADYMRVLKHIRSYCFLLFKLDVLRS